MSTTLQVDNSYKISVMFFGHDMEFTIDASDGLTRLKQIKDKDLTKIIYMLELELPVNVAYTLTKSQDYRIQLSIETGKSLIIDADLSDAESDGGSSDSRLLYPFSSSDLQLDDALVQQLEAGGVVENTSEYDTHTVKFTIEAFEVKDMVNNLKLMNMCLRNATVEDAFVECIKRSGISVDNLIFTIPDNTVQYEEIFIPPLDFVGALRYIEKTFGVYRSKMILFFDSGSLIIKPSNAEAPAPGWIPTIRIFSGTNLLENVATYYEKHTYIDETDATVLYEEPIKVRNNITEILKTLGSKFFTNDEKDHSIMIQEINVDLLNTGLLQELKNFKLPEKQRHLVNKLRNNNFAFELEKKDIHSKMLKTVLIIPNADASAYSLQKIFPITFFDDTNSKYSGNWSPTNVTISYERVRHDYICNIYLDLYRIIE